MPGLGHQPRSVEKLSPDTIAHAALAVIDVEGPDALSFRRLGKELGVTQTTVHRHCGGIDGLLDLCVDYLARGFPPLDPDLSWADATELLFMALYRVMTAHPALVALRRGRPWLGPEVLARLVEPALQANLSAGMTPRQMIVAYRQMYLYTLGCAVFVDHQNPAAAVRRTRTALAALDPAEFPALTGHLATVLEAVVDHEVYRDGLRRLIRAADPALA